MKWQIKHFLLSCMAAAALEVGAAEIANIKFEQKGPNPVPQEMLMLTLRLRPGMEFKQEHLDQDIKNLYAGGKVADVVSEVRRLPDGKVDIFYRITPAEMIKQMNIVGNKKFQTKDLISCFKVNEGERLNNVLLSESLDAIRKFYREKGYNDVRILPPKIVSDKKGGVIVTVTIEENLRLKINNVDFEGATVFSERELRNALANSYSYWNLVPFINDYLNRGLLQRNELDLDKARLRELYHNKGYLDFKVADVVITPKADDPEYVDILFKIEEGKPYTVDNVTFSGNRDLDSKLIAPCLKLISGKGFTSSDEQSTIRAITAIYDARGYTDVTVRAVRSENFKDQKVSVRFNISEGRKYYVNEVILVGNTSTKAKVLLREMAIQPGDPVAKNRMNISRQRLLGMGYFQSVNVEAVNADDFNAKDIRVTVEEKPERYNFRIGAGASDINSFFGMAEISTDNFDITNPKNWFYGGGQRMRIQGIYGIDNAGFNVDFIEPWLFDLPLRFELSSYMTQAEYDEWYEQRIGVRTSLQRKIFDDFTTVSAGYKFEVVRVHHISSTLKPYFKANHLGGTFLVSQPSLMIARDTRDSLVDPTEGYYINLFSSITPEIFGSSDNYYRLEAKGSYHISFFDKAIVAMVGAKMGVVSNFNYNDEVPVFERYLLGGSGSLRGFKYRSVGPLESDRNVGGQTMLLLTAEVSHPIWGPLRGAAFVDAGGTWDDPYKLNWGKFNIGVGYGFRLKLPMIKAPLKLDLAFPVLNNQDNESSKLRIHFNVGFTF